MDVGTWACQQVLWPKFHPQDPQCRRREPIPTVVWGKIKPWVNEILKSWRKLFILLLWAQPWQGPKPETHEKMSSSSSTHIQRKGQRAIKASELMVYAENPPQYFPLDICGLKTAILHRLIQPIYLNLFPWSCSLPKPWLLIYMYLTTLPLCSIVYYKYTGLLGHCSFFISELMPTGPRFSASLSFFMPSQPQSG